MERDKDQGGDQGQPAADQKIPATKSGAVKKLPVEIGGPKGLEPTRYGDWERNGRCSDF